MCRQRQHICIISPYVGLSPAEKGSSHPICLTRHPPPHHHPKPALLLPVKTTNTTRKFILFVVTEQTTAPNVVKKLADSVAISSSSPGGWMRHLHLAHMPQCDIRDNEELETRSERGTWSHFQTWPWWGLESAWNEGRLTWRGSSSNTWASVCVV